MPKCDKCPGVGTVLILIGASILVGCSVWFSGWASGRNETYLEAVREGHAVWVPDPQTGKPQIEWKDK